MLLSGISAFRFQLANPGFYNVTEVTNRLCSLYHNSYDSSIFFVMSITTILSILGFSLAR